MADSRVLLVEDSPADARLVEVMLGDAASSAFELVLERSLAEGIRRMRDETFDVVLLDLALPDSRGLETFLKTQEEAPNVPIIVLTGLEDEALAAEAARHGAQDYLVKGEVDPAPLARAIRYAIARKRAQDALHVQERALAAVSDGVVIVAAGTTDREIIYCNDAFTRVTGYSRDELLGKDARVLLGRGRSQEGEEEVRAALDAGRESQALLLRCRRNGTQFWAELTLSPVVLGSEVTHYVVVVRDVTERRRVEEQLRRRHRLEAVGQLAGGVAHDFNNLLTIILGNAQLTLDEVSEKSSIHKRLVEIGDAGNRAAALTKQLLAFSRRQVLEPKFIDMNDLVRDLSGMLRRVLPEDIDMTTVFDDSLGSIRADPGQLEQVLMNLVVNSRDAMPEGGELTIETARVDASVADVKELDPMPAGRYVRLTVRDNGIGMDAETQARIFEPFFTTKPERRGTGLGLATVYGIVKQSGGFIWVESEPGLGTAFQLYFPRLEHAPEKLRHDESPKRVPAGSETVLVVEDDAAVLAVASKTLRNNGYDVLEANNPNDALRTAAEHKGSLHLLVTDVVMPSASGPQLAERICELHPGCTVLYMTGYAEEGLTRKGLVGEGEGIHVLRKPFTPDSLLLKVRSVLGKGSAESGETTDALT